MSRPARFALVGTLVLAAAAVGTASGGDDGKSRQVVGLFKDVSPLEVGSEIRASGVKVGEVQDIELQNGLARVVLDIDSAVFPLHQDARLSIRPINLLGENFIELQPGSADQPSLRGAIPVEQTSTVTTLQDVLDTVDDPTGTALAALVGELGSGVEGNGEQMAAALKALAPTMQQVDRLGDVLRAQNDVLGELLTSADPLATAAAGPDGKRMDALVEQTRNLLVALGAEQDGIKATIAQLPATLKEARTTLSALDRVADATAPTLRQARPVTDDLDQIAGEIEDFTVYATPAFASFDGVFAEADRLLEQAAPMVTALRRSGDDLESVAEGLVPVGDQLLDRHLGDLMAFVRKWALSTNGRDAVSHYFRGVFHVTPAALTALVKGAPLLSPSDGGHRTPESGTGAAGAPAAPAAPEDLSGAIDQVTKLLGKDGVLDLCAILVTDPECAQVESGATDPAAAVPAPAADPTSATGLDVDQELGLLGQLLGGLGGLLK
ncbi:MlaD family protein [Nocardioides daeguensis]|uniref:MlaD family protein n=1 Tax=Nocardioides daeguensis TaxID=908359 RepID=UPI001C47EF01|nr:MlaD family protein [Nocardioides daeguensis]